WASIMITSRSIVPDASRPKLYVVPLGCTRPQASENVPAVVTRTSRGELSWHWLVLASVNDADSSGWLVRPVMLAPAEAVVAVAQLFSRWSTPFAYLATVQPVWPGSKMPGWSAAAAPPAKASAEKATAANLMALPLHGSVDRKRRLTERLPLRVAELVPEDRVRR